ncbi:hypothetical protein BKA58DRAFT_55089 [Alternaria rosae]|uniref:uncharacterized protein n=1 Tax=Alternaria rosae TaxID=1187941 RepID=UPI001E8E41D5|nr:uncharacterized protein BKA58DRAFT_55089 [Alternaria rosae]KAH6857200.1 hypothetical protein BKA58DRAFT_55089 [Alternaria rosae]
MVRASTVAESQCVHFMVAEHTAKFTAGIIVYAFFAVDAFFKMAGKDKHPAILAWLVLILFSLYVLTGIVLEPVHAISKKYKVDNATGLQYILSCIYLLAFLSMCAAMRFAIPKGYLLVWSSFFLLPVSPVGRTCIDNSRSS